MASWQVSGGLLEGLLLEGKALISYSVYQPVIVFTLMQRGENCIHFIS